MPRRSFNEVLKDVHDYNISIKTRCIYLHSRGDTEQAMGVEFKMACEFIKNIHILNDQVGDVILVHMQSPGGEWFDGMAMFHAVRFSPSPIAFLAYGQASSMSGILLQAADKRILMPDCEVMVHHGDVGMIETNSIAAKSIIDSNERTCHRMLMIFARRCKTGKFFKQKKWSEEQIARFIDKKIHNKSDWYMPAEEALYYGMCDGILGERGFEDVEKIKSITKKYNSKI